MSLQTHQWNTVAAEAVWTLAHRVGPDAEQVIKIARSLANEDGVYTLAELQALQGWVALPDQLEKVLDHLARETGAFDLTDLRQALRDSESDIFWEEMEDTQDGDGHDLETFREPVTLLLGVPLVSLRPLLSKWEERALGLKVDEALLLRRCIADLTHVMNTGRQGIRS